MSETTIETFGSGAKDAPPELMTPKDGVLTIGTRRYSSWSLRGWLPVKLARLDVEIRVIPLAGGVTPAVKAVSPSGYVPFLHYDADKIWDSLAICEYCAELMPTLWPAEAGARAHARSISAEMHAGFRDLRVNMPMSLFRSAEGTGQTPECLADIARIDALWCDTRARFGTDGPYLFGAEIGIADAMYAPVVFRFMTYRPTLSPVAQLYVSAMLDHALMREWLDAARDEPKEWHIARMEAPAAP